MFCFPFYLSLSFFFFCRGGGSFLKKERRREEKLQKEGNASLHATLITKETVADAVAAARRERRTKRKGEEA